MSSPSTPRPRSAGGDTGLARVAKTLLPTEFATFDTYAYVESGTGAEHVALVLGDLSGDEPPLVRVHSECLTGDALGSHRCDCGDQLTAAQRAIAQAGRGVVVYLRGHEGRGIGLSAKLRAYELQDGGLDTVDANLALGLPSDLRSYQAAAEVLRDLGVSRVRLLSSNPLKQEQLADHGIEVVDRFSLPVPARAENARYLEAKRTRMGHAAAPAAGDEVWRELVAGRVPAGAARDAFSTTLIERYGPIVAAGDQLVLARLGQSLDGFAARADQGAGPVDVTGAADHEHLARLRALVDAVIVGDDAAGGGRPVVATVGGAGPLRVVLDPRGQAPRDAALTGGPVLWCVAPGARPPGPLATQVELLELPVTDGRFAPVDVVAALAARGHGRVLVEGGGRTVSEFLTAGVVDRMSVTVAPRLVGAGVPGLRLDGDSRLAEAWRVPARRFELGDDVCFELDLTATRDPDTVARHVA